MVCSAVFLSSVARLPPWFRDSAIVASGDYEGLKKATTEMSL